MTDEVLNRTFTRRDFLKATACCVFFWGIPSFGLAQQEKKGLIGIKLSPHFLALNNQRIQCQLCPRQCLVANGQRGFCGVRENREGKYYSLVYGNPCAVHVDAIEKKPFYHLLPASTSFSIATAGCNFRCKFCQNWEISQTPGFSGFWGRRREGKLGISWHGEYFLKSSSTQFAKECLISNRNFQNCR
jgi:hypothetical protein